jgi:diguanylate cyclase (GGDEF)-like protein/PAS domain S-box-containing protein
MIKVGHVKSFMVCFAPLSAVFFAIVGFLAWEGSSARHTALASDQRFALEKTISVLRERIEVVVSDLLILSESGQLEATINGQLSKQQLAEEYALIAQRRGVYDQIRFIDNAGMEVVRVNYGSGVPYAVGENDLQDKSTRPYFNQVQMAARGTIYVSGIDLNEEFGQIEKPIKPVIRLSAPVFDSLGVRLGVVVLNLRAAPILDEMTRSLSLNDAHPFVVDNEGNWLKGGQEGENWSLDLTGKAAVMADRYPDAWENMRLGREGFRSENGYFTVQRLQVPDLLLMRTMSRSVSVIFGEEEGLDNSLNLFVGMRLSNDALDAQIWPDRGALITISVAFLVLIAIGSAAYSWTRQRQVRASFDARLSEQVLRASKNSVVVTDEAGLILKVNPGFTALTGYLPNEAVGKPLSFLRAEREKRDELDDILMAARAHGTWEGEVHNRRKDGDFYYANTVVSSITNPNTAEVNFVEMGLDISRHMENAQELWRQANHDALTGLPNRLLFEDRLDVACSHAETEGHNVGLIYFDLDGFKPINDRYGHEVGDQVLRKVADRIKNTVRQGDTVARLGGDEFVVIVDDLKDKDEADWVKQKIASSIKRPIEIGSLSLSVGASFGVSMYPGDSREAMALVGLADAQMYKDKNAKRSMPKAANS